MLTARRKSEGTGQEALRGQCETFKSMQDWRSTWGNEVGKVGRRWVVSRP